MKQQCSENLTYGLKNQCFFDNDLQNQRSFTRCSVRGETVQKNHPSPCNAEFTSHYLPQERFFDNPSLNNARHVSLNASPLTTGCTSSKRERLETERQTWMSNLPRSAQLWKHVLLQHAVPPGELIQTASFGRPPTIHLNLCRGSWNSPHVAAAGCGSSQQRRQRLRLDCGWAVAEIGLRLDCGWATVGLQLGCGWTAAGLRLRLGCGWAAVGIRLDCGCGWTAAGLRLGCSWDTAGLRLGCGWAAVGIRLDCGCGWAAAAAGLWLGCSWDTAGLRLGCGWAAAGLRLGCGWAAAGLRCGSAAKKSAVSG